MLQKFEGYRQQ